MTTPPPSDPDPQQHSTSHSADRQSPLDDVILPVTPLDQGCSEADRVVLPTCYKKFADEFATPMSAAETRAVEAATKNLRSWQDRLSNAQRGHYFMTERYSKWNIILGVGTVVVSSAVTVFAALEATVREVNLVIVFSLVATALTGLQTMFRLSERSEEHRTRAARYGALKRKIEAFLISPVRMRHIRRMVEVVTVEWDAIADDSPVTPQWVINRVNQSSTAGTNAGPVSKWVAWWRRWRP